MVDDLSADAVVRKSLTCLPSEVRIEADVFRARFFRKVLQVVGEGIVLRSIVAAIKSFFGNVDTKEVLFFDGLALGRSTFVYPPRCINIRGMTAAEAL